MQLLWIIRALQILGCTFATRMCPRCIPLENLVTPALGIQLSLRELSLAISYHNGSSSHVARIDGSADYQEMMFRYRDESQGRRLQNPFSSCPRPWTPAKPTHWFQGILTYLGILTKDGHQARVDAAAIEPKDSDTETSTLYSNIHTLLQSDDAVSNMTAKRVGLAIPEWFLDHQACKIFTATHLAGKEPGKLAYAPEAAFSAFEYPLCQIDSEWMACSAPGRIMTLEFTRDAMTAAVIQTPDLWWGCPDMVYAYNNILGQDRSLESFDDDGERLQAMAQWMNVFVEANKPDKAILIGGLTGDLVYQKAVSLSKVSALIVPNPRNIDLQDAVVLGAARMMKEKMESHRDDCIEFDECDRIREEADRLAGGSGEMEGGHEADRTEL